MEEPLDASVKNSSNEIRENRFQTKDGFCYVYPDRIIITDGSDPSKVRRDPAKEDARRNLYLAISFLVALSLGFLALVTDEGTTSFSSNKIPLPVLLGIGSLGGIAAFVSGFRKSYTPIIERNSIEYINDDSDNDQGALAFLKRYRIQVCFRDRTGRKWKRRITLPSVLNEGKVEYQKAMKILRREGLID